MARSRGVRFGRLAAWPAGIIDRTYLQESNGWLSRLWSGIKVRFIYTFLFAPLSLVDLICAGFAATGYAIGVSYTTDGPQKKLLEQQQRFATIFSKNFFALLAFTLGLIFPKLVVFYFTPEKRLEKGVEAGGDLYQSDAELKKPQDDDESTKEDKLKTIIIDAAKTGKKIMPVGAGRSQGKQFLPAGEAGIVVDLKHFNDIKINRDGKTATVGAGVRWADLQTKANAEGLALQVMQASNVFSVGGSIGTNIHGWDHRMGTLSNTLLSMDIIDAQGVKHTLTRENPLFHKITGGIGLFGVVISATFQLTDNELLKEYGERVELKDYAKYFKEKVLTDEDTRLHYFRLSLDPANLLGEGIAVSYKREQPGRPKLARSTDLMQEDPRGTRSDQIMINAARRFGALRKRYWDTEVQRMLDNDSHPLMTRNEIMQPPINAMFNPSVSESEWLQEYFLPGDELDVFLKNLGAILMKNDVILLNASVRFVKQNDDALFSYSKGEDRFAVVLCFNQPLQKHEIIKAQKWLREAQQLALNHRGTFYLPYQEVTSPEQFAEAYPVEQIREAKKAVDPQGIFASGVYDKYIAKKEMKPNYFKKIMETEESQKKFAGFLENVLQRVDTKPFYDLLVDILNYKDTHEEIYAELLARMSEISPNAFGTLSRILSSLSAIKTDLAVQAKRLLADLPKGDDGQQEINGLVEIGYPGRFVGGFQENFKVTGHIAAVHEGEGLTDYLQTGFPRPYDQFAKLDYMKPNLAALKDNSAEVITCYVGLHHFPPKELDHFLDEIRRVLKPGGRFLLVDHDVVDEESLAMAHMAHMVFNAVNGVSLKEEMTEIRDFHSMMYWQQKLEEHQLGYAVKGPDVPMIRQGDPSRNRMSCFVNGPKPELRFATIDAIAAMSEAQAESAPLLQYDVGARDINIEATDEFAAIARRPRQSSAPSITQFSDLYRPAPAAIKPVARVSDIVVDEESSSDEDEIIFMDQPHKKSRKKTNL